MVFKTGAFQLSPDMTPDQVQRKRAMIAALLPKFGSAKYVGEGIGQLATGVMAGRQGRKLDEIEGKGIASANSLWERLMGTANSAQSPDMGPLSVLGPTDPWVAGAEAPAGPDPTKTYLGMPDVAEGGLSFPGQPKVTPEGSSGLSFGSNVGQSSGGSAEAIFRETLLAGGLPAHAVEGIMMNAHDESAFNPNAVGDSGAAFGMLQWNGPRKRALEKFAAENGENPADPAVQAKFTLYELQGPESAAGRALLAAGTAGEAGAAFVNHYERPAESHRARREAAYLGGGGRTAGSGGSSAGAAATAPTSAPSIPINELYMALQNPWLSGEQKGLITSMIQEQQQASDPLYQLQLAQAQADLAKSTAPAGPPEELTTRMALAENAGLERGTPEYQHYMLTGKLPEAAEPGYRTMTADEAKQLGLPPGAYQMGPNGEIKAIGGGGVNVSVDTGGGSPPSDEALRKKLMEAEGVAWGEYLKAGSTASGMTQDMELLGQVIEMAPQGPISGRLAEAFPGVSDAAGVFQSVVKRIAPSLRVEGSGAQSDIEYNGFLQSLPSLSNRPEANRAIATFLKAKAAINMERGQVIQQYQNGEIDATAARTKIKEIDSRSILSPELKNLLGSMDGGAESGDMSEDDAAYLRSLGMEP